MIKLKNLLKEGASTSIMSYDGTRQKLEKAFKTAQKEDEKETGGDPYTHGFHQWDGLEFYNVVMTKAAAQKYIEKNTEKWENALAIPLDKKGKKWIFGGWMGE